jgi:hypothetical protein
MSVIDGNLVAVSRRLYTAVAANDLEVDEYTPPDGATLHVEKYGGDAAIDTEVKVEIKFGTDVIFATHTTDNQNVPINFACDGVKKMQLRLVNDSAVTETIGGYWSGFIVE